MTPRAGRTRPCEPGEAKRHLARARAYLQLAELADEAEFEDKEPRRASIGNAVLAGIAATDALTCIALRERSASGNHADTVRLLARTRDADDLVQSLRDLLMLKGSAHYGMDALDASQATRAVRRARSLVDHAATALGGRG